MRQTDDFTKKFLMDQAQRMFAMSASLFDSDVIEAAQLAIQGRQSAALMRASNLVVPKRTFSCVYKRKRTFSLLFTNK